MKNRSILILIFTFLMITVITSCTPSVPPVQYGSIDINSTPSGAKVFLNGVDSGMVTPIIFNREVGSYTIKLDKFHHKLWEGTVTVNANQTTYINPPLAYASLESLTLQTDSWSKDSYVEEKLPETNYGSANLLWVGNCTAFDADGKYRSYLQFDLSAVPPNARVVDAHLEIKNYSKIRNDMTVELLSIGLYQVTDSWLEGNITWDNQPASSIQPESIVKINMMIWSDWYAWNINDLFAGWLNGTIANDGVLLKVVDEIANAGMLAKFHSSDASEGNSHPKLMIDYYLP